MEDLKQAYAALGLPETASKDEVEKRYFLLTRRARAQKMREQADLASEELVDIDAVTAAYRFIRDYEEQQAKAEYEKKHYGKYKGMADKAKKWDHFFHYYKIHIIVGIIVLIAIGFGVKSYMDHRAEQERLAKLPPPDLRIMFYGNYYYQGSFSVDTEQMGAQALEQFPEWQRIISNLIYVPAEVRSEQDMAFIQKSIVSLLDDKSDLFILDRANFDKLVNEDLFAPLETLPGDSAALASSDAAVKTSTIDDPAERAYGIDLSDTPLADDMDLEGSTEYIAAIRADTEHTDNAVAFIEHYLQP
ncbi:hypothetical protein COLU111180_00320 [Cohnella lubricantis]|uniref:J domain-containing protein n=1 Tax=Cohnella lubricantis TaxID=2163172 RepID=A0A841TAN8_9BACL|nr:hypothetical protein [Cohnella lubricantis]MBB6677095.1 hypothetical protein [Cohnella lubricantis]MBP2118942.1 hypothetical protein [Cohnella lubricantis]